MFLSLQTWVVLSDVSCVHSLGPKVPSNTDASSLASAIPVCMQTDKRPSKTFGPEIFFLSNGDIVDFLPVQLSHDCNSKRIEFGPGSNAILTNFFLRTPDCKDVLTENDKGRLYHSTTR